MNNNNIMEQLERLAAAFPWDKVDIWVCREPQGAIEFKGIVHDNRMFGFDFVSATGSTPEESVDKVIAHNENRRNPESARESKIEELQEQIKRLLSVEIGLPPYVPNRELAQRNNRCTVDV